MNSALSILGALWPLCLAVTLTAQETSVLESARAEVGLRSLQTASKTSPSEGAPALLHEAAGLDGYDEEIGEQRFLKKQVKAEWEPWLVEADAQYFYTDNVGLARDGELGDAYLRGGVTVQYNNRIAGPWSVNASAASHVYLHDRFSALDFNLTRSDLALTYELPALRTMISAGWSWYRISQSDLTTHAFDDHLASVLIQKLWKPRSGLEFVAGMMADISLAPEPAGPGRDEYSAYAGTRLRLRTRLTITGSYRAGWHHYREVDRQDWNHVVQLGVAYEVTSWAKVGIMGSMTFNRSSVSFFDYDNLVTGGGLFFNARF
ncbi:MAG: outer membrane beta-barrel protein [Verrucomicrobiaceae bacterium]|nr:outer membrane beta-barrel protein [Verrucomicrobiaceae bacterium]